jgi:hypothetical protein
MGLMAFDQHYNDFVFGDWAEWALGGRTKRVPGHPALSSRGGCPGTGSGEDRWFLLLNTYLVIRSIYSPLPPPARAGAGAGAHREFR